jgi:putative flavoprotein involved in K+ transport
LGFLPNPYRLYPDFSWIQFNDLLNEYGQPVHQKGISPIKDLFFLGLPWLSRRGSALLGWVGQDAEFLASLVSSK